MKQGKYTREELTPDGLHSNDKGHGLVAGEIIAFLEEVRKQMPENVDDNTNNILKPMTENAYENARRLTIREIDWKTDHRFCMILFVIRNVRILQLRKLYSRKR